MKIGIDGGGTKTECILVDANGTIVGRHTAPGCNPSHVGPDRAREILETALLALLAPRSSLPAPSTTLLCMAGSPDFWRETASSLAGYGRIETATDALPVLELATAGLPGLVLHAGTGSFVALRAPDGSVHYLGGLGWRLGDPGSAHDIGRRALVRGLAELQAWAAPSEIGQLVREEFSTSEAGAITAALHRDPEPNVRIASLAARVSSLAGGGGAAAREIVLASTGGLLACATAAAGRFFGNENLNTIRAGLSGPILTQAFVFEALARQSRLALTAVTEPPIEGVRRLLLRIS